MPFVMQHPTLKTFLQRLPHMGLFGDLQTAHLFYTHEEAWQWRSKQPHAEILQVSLEPAGVLDEVPSFESQLLMELDRVGIKGATVDRRGGGWLVRVGTRRFPVAQDDNFAIRAEEIRACLDRILSQIELEASTLRKCLRKDGLP